MDEMSRDYGHVPVLMREAIMALAPKEGGVYIDATLGGGGYTRAILESAECHVIGVDRDPSAISYAREWGTSYGDRLTLYQAPFSQLDSAVISLPFDRVDGVVFDLGVSSVQLDQADRGFSFMRDGDLSMRMDQAEGKKASDLINIAPEEDLANIFYVYGDEKKSRQAARAIVTAREMQKIETTLQLADIIKSALGARGYNKIHPATRIFQAIRIFVNDEIGQLAKGLSAAERILRPAGKLVVVTFHSLEDRLVKRFLAPIHKDDRTSRHMPIATQPEPSRFSLLDKKARGASDQEVGNNPRARSAKLRAGIRTEAPARELTAAFLKKVGVPQPNLSPALNIWR